MNSIKWSSPRLSEVTVEIEKLKKWLPQVEQQTNDTIGEMRNTISELGDSVTSIKEELDDNNRDDSTAEVKVAEIEDELNNVTSR